MKSDLLEILNCPACRHSLKLEVEQTTGHRVIDGHLLCHDCQAKYPIVNAIPRFVDSRNYAGTFGLQWNLFRQTQLDSHTQQAISRNRFFDYSGWLPEELAGKQILDVGCGAGRFAEIALNCGANVVALDYSTAVDAAMANLGDYDSFSVVQGDIYRLPFKPQSFDYVYCFGVLQHTPDVSRAFAALPEMLKSKGKLAVDVYPKLLLNYFWPKYWIRPVTKRIPEKKLLELVRTMVRYLLPVSKLVGRVPKFGPKLKYAIPVLNYDRVFPLSAEQQIQWSILDTFDMLSAFYDQPQSLATLHQWFLESGLMDIKVFRKGFNVGRGRKPI